MSYFDEFFCPVDYNKVITRSSNRKIKLSFWKTKLQIQILLYAGPILEIAFLKHLIKEYSLKKIIWHWRSNSYSYT